VVGGGFRVISEGVSLRFKENRCRRDDLLLTSGGGGSCCIGIWLGRGDGGAGVYVRGERMKCSGSGEEECCDSDSGVRSRS
jgi:hypothetical protein